MNYYSIERGDNGCIRKIYYTDNCKTCMYAEPDGEDYHLGCTRLDTGVLFKLRDKKTDEEALGLAHKEYKPNDKCPLTKQQKFFGEVFR